MSAFSKQIFITSVTNALQDIMQFVADALIKEYEDQGHRLTGALADTLRIEITQLTDGVMGIIYLNDYYRILDKGVRPERIPYNPGSGKKHSKYIQALIEYFRLRLSVNEETAKGIAFATANKQKQEGMPTRGSHAFSKNGKRLDFFTGTILNSQAAITRGVDQLFGKAMSNVIDELNTRIQGEIILRL